MYRKIILLLLLVPVLFFLAACFPIDPVVNKYTLQVSVTGNGTVSPSFGQYPQGTIIAFDVRPSQGWKFSRWEGNNRYEVVGSQGNWSICMNSNNP